MKKLMFVTLGVAALVIGSQPVVAQAQVADAIQAVNDAIVELTDAPGLGKRTTVDVTKRWGSDRSVIDSATAKLQDGLSKAQSGGVGARCHAPAETGCGLWQVAPAQRSAAVRAGRPPSFVCGE